MPGSLRASPAGPHAVGSLAEVLGVRQVDDDMRSRDGRSVAVRVVMDAVEISCDACRETSWLDETGGSVKLLSACVTVVINNEE